MATASVQPQFGLPTSVFELIDLNPLGDFTSASSIREPVLDFAAAKVKDDQSILDQWSPIGSISDSDDSVESDGLVPDLDSTECVQGWTIPPLAATSYGMSGEVPLWLNEQRRDSITSHALWPTYAAAMAADHISSTGPDQHILLPPPVVTNDVGSSGPAVPHDRFGNSRPVPLFSHSVRRADDVDNTPLSVERRSWHSVDTPSPRSPTSPPGRARRRSSNRCPLPEGWCNSLLAMSTKELNRYFKSKKLSAGKIAELKTARRRIKNRSYTRDSRSRKFAREAGLDEIGGSDSD